MNTLRIRPRGACLLGVVPLIYVAWDLGHAAYKFAFLYSGLKPGGTGYGYDPSNVPAMVIAIGAAILAGFSLLAAAQILTVTLIDRAVVELDESGVTKRIFLFHTRRWPWSAFARSHVNARYVLLETAGNPPGKPVVLATKVTGAIDPAAITDFIRRYAPHIQPTA